MIEGIKENTLNLKTSRNRSRRIWMLIIRWSKSGVTIKHTVRTKVHNSAVSKMARLFDKLLLNLRMMINVTAETFKRNLDVWLKDVPNTPKQSCHYTFIMTKKEPLKPLYLYTCKGI